MTNTWTNDYQMSLDGMTTLSNALYKPWVYPLRQPTMSPTNVVTPTVKMEKF